MEVVVWIWSGGHAQVLNPPEAGARRGDSGNGGVLIGGWPTDKRELKSMLSIPTR